MFPTVVGGIALLLVSLVGCTGADDAADTRSDDPPAAAAASSSSSGGAGGGTTGTDGSGQAPASAVPDAQLELAANVAMVMAAVDAVDSAGFHGMAEGLDEATDVNPRLAGQVSRVLVAARAPEWDPALSHGVEEFMEALDKLHVALEAEDLEGARLGAHLVHEAQHHFSPEVYSWLSEQHLDSNADAAALVTGLAAVDAVDAVGFHGIAEDLAEASEVNPRTAGRVHNALIAVQTAVWPDVLATAVSDFERSLEELRAALEADDLENARVAADAVHGTQHDFSAGWYDWLSANHAAIDHSHPEIARAAALKVIDVVNSFGLHGISEELETATEISPRLARNVENLVAVMNGEHFGPVSETGASLREHLSELQQAAAAGDIAAAHEAAHGAHELQHDLSNGMYAWIASAQTTVAASGGHAHEDGDDHEHGSAEVAAYLEEAPKDRAVELTMDNFSYGPDTIEIGAGEVVELQVTNLVDVPHDFTIAAIAAEVHVSHLPGTGEHVHIEGMEEADLHFALTEAGEGVVHLRVNEPGTYEFICTVPGHRELGMVGTLIVN
jgi:uncharacterized cupredoxin-like copper-binding protein